MSEDPTPYKVSRSHPNESIKIRINNIEFVSASDNLSGEFRKYYKNEKFDKLEEYLKDGYVLSPLGNFVKKDNYSIDVSLFNREELCLVIGDLDYNTNEDCCTLTSIGTRILNLSPQDREDFFSVYHFAESKMHTLNFNNDLV